jgi:hypothetical protein
MKKIIYTMLLMCSATLVAQEVKPSKASLDFGADFQSRYIWRGLQFGGSSPSIQPSIELSSGSFTIGGWAAYSTGGVNQAQEADLYISLAASDALSFTLTDYFFPTEGIKQDYFSYGSDTGHVYELAMTYASDKTPWGFTIATNIAGADKNGSKQNYSTYFELNYSKSFDGVDYSLFAGGVVSDNSGYYLTTGSGLINLGLSASKSVKLSKTFELPINTALIFNPDQGNVYLTFGFSL